MGNGAVPNTNPDYDLPGNDLDFNTPTPAQLEPVPRLMKAYGVLCMVDGIISIPLLIAVYVLVIFAARFSPELASIGSSPTLTLFISIVSAVFSFGDSVGMFMMGRALIKNRRRPAGMWAYALMVITAGEIVTSVMLDGLDLHLVLSAVQLVIVLVIHATVDPSLHQERGLQRRLGDLQDRAAAEEGMLGRDITGEGYIKLNFFNLFWVFVVCSVIGLVLEVIWHMVVVDPGVYQDRAGLLFGPFSPIYGCGAVLMTIALNRFYRANPIIIFLVSALIGGAFEVAVSFFMQMSFGAVAWDYTGQKILGLVLDPVAVLCGGRTSTMFAGIWGILGLVWIKLCLPRMLALINLMPWKLRYSLTSVAATLMAVNCFMTLGALDCWFERVSGLEPSSPIEEFNARYFDNEYMENRFESMTINPDDSTRVAPSETV